ncbi:MAG: hypothetical protein U1F98_12430 [Verrucomicrobiota bacterium]
MNRSILIVICDFLLVSLLTFSTLEVNRVADEGTRRPQDPDAAAKPVGRDNDLATAMRLALDEERKAQEQLVAQLARSREAVTQREQQFTNLQEELAARDRQAQKLLQDQSALQEQYAQAQTNLQSLNRQLQNSASATLLSNEKLSALEAELKKKSDESEALQRQLAQLASSNQAVLSEKQQLAGQLQIAEVEKRHAAEQVNRMTEEVKTEREEKAKLAEGVKALATKSGQLEQEIRANTALTPNLVFSQFITNRVQARISAVKSGRFADASNGKQAQTILVGDGTNIFALCHVQDTPLTFGSPGTDWAAMSGVLSRNETTLPIRSLSFYWPDPRLVLIPVSPEDARRLGGKIYPVAHDPFKFQEAFLIGAQEGYYGECRFEIDLATPDYVKLDRNLLKGLFGKFNPSRGDLVFNKTGELLGVMANSTYCMLINKFDAMATFQFGDDVRPQHPGEVLSQLASQVNQMPQRLQ